jgi:WD40 repeat protein
VLASAGSFGLVQLWDVNKGTRIRGLMQNWIGIGIYAVAFSPDGKVLATAQRYGPVRLYDVQQLLGAVTD